MAAHQGDRRHEVFLELLVGVNEESERFDEAGHTDEGEAAGLTAEELDRLRHLDDVIAGLDPRFRRSRRG